MVMIHIVVAVVTIMVIPREANAGLICYAYEFSQAFGCASRRCGNRDIACDEGNYNINGVKYKWMCGCSAKISDPRGSDIDLNLDGVEGDASSVDVQKIIVPELQRRGKSSD